MWALRARTPPSPQNCVNCRPEIARPFPARSARLRTNTHRESTREAHAAMKKKALSEDDIRAKYITPAMVKAGWDEITPIRHQVCFTKGRIILRGKLVTRGNAKRADFILYRCGIPIAIIEAKDNNHPVGAGMEQALEYALTLDVPLVFSSNDDAFVFHDRTGQSAQLETTLALDAFPSPETLSDRYRTWKNLASALEPIVLQPYFDDGSGKDPRYYQRNAINAAVEAIQQ